MRISSELLAQIVDHALRDAPDECCGFVALREGRAVAVHEVENTAHSPLRFEVAPPDVLRLGEMEEAVIYHSHTRSAPYPSQTDITFAVNWPGVQWLIVGTAGEEPEVRNYRIDGGVVTEVAIEVGDEVTDGAV